MTTEALTTRVINEVPPLLSEVAGQAIPAELDELVAACLEKQRESRPASILAVKEVLDRVAEQNRWTQAEAQSAWESGHKVSEASP